MKSILEYLKTLDTFESMDPSDMTTKAILDELAGVCETYSKTGELDHDRESNLWAEIERRIDNGEEPQ